MAARIIKRVINKWGKYSVAPFRLTPTASLLVKYVNIDTYVLWVSAGFLILLHFSITS